MRDMVLRGLEQAYDNLVHMIAEFLPRFVVMLIIILIGWLAAFLLKQILRAVLRLTKIDRISEEAGASRVLRKAALPPMSELLSRSFFWVVWLGFFLLGISILQISSLQDEIGRFIVLLPQFFVALLILFFGLLLANFCSRATLLAAVNAGIPSPGVLSWVVRFVIWILAIAMSLEQIGLARTTVVAAFSIVFGAVMFGLALAFGLGGRELARHALEKYLGKMSEEKDKPSPL
jgi:Mechanosensitive ion channel, conserved TM helix